MFWTNLTFSFIFCYEYSEADLSFSLEEKSGQHFLKVLLIFL